MDQKYSEGSEASPSHEDGDGVLRPCPAIDVLRLLVGKWKPEILQLASQNKIRFNSLLRKIPGSNKQSLSVALRELEQANVLHKNVVSAKPPHVEYTLTDRGRSMIPIFHVASRVAAPNTEKA